MNLDALIHRKFPPITQRYEAKDTILYALGVGVGADPVDPVQLPYVYEKHLRILPSQSTDMNANCGSTVSLTTVRSSL